MKTIQHSASSLKRALAAALVGTALLHSSAALAQANSRPPERMTYQGYLTGADGVALGVAAPKNYDVIFRIYDSESGTTPLWGEQQTVTVDKGYFSVLLGEGAAVSGIPNSGITLSSLFASATASDRYVGFTVKGIGTGGADVDILPRGRLLSTPYAFLASRAVKLVQDNASGADLLTSSGSQLILSGKLGISGANTVEFGYGVAGKEQAAGMISYGGFTPSSLDIVGAGSSSTNRKIKLWAEGGTTFSGPIAATGAVSGTSLVASGTVSGSSLSATDTVSGNIIQGNGYRLNGVGIFEFGYGVAGKNQYAGMITYGQFTPNSLDIVGAGFSLTDRKIKLWAEGGTSLSGNIGVGATATTAAITCPSVLGEKLILFGADTAANWGLGIANNTMQIHVPDSGGNIAFGYGNSGSMTTTTKIKGSGWMGVNTGSADPVAPLEVKGYAFRREQYVSLKSEWYVETFGTLTTSDERIKEVVSRGDSNADLQAVEALRVTDYRFRDQRVSRDKVVRGFLGQEVRKVLPNAVNLSTQFVPDLCAVPKSLNRDTAAKTVRITLENAHGLQVGDRVRLTDTESTGGRSTDVTVRQVPDANTLVVDDEQVPDQVLVYGREVKDFHTVDYNQLFVTGIGAIQSLAKRVRGIEEREARVGELERRAARVDSLERDVAELRKLVARIAEGGKGGQQASADGPVDGGASSLQQTSVRRDARPAVTR